MHRLRQILFLVLFSACHDNAPPSAASGAGRAAEPPTPPTTPAALRVPDDQKVVLRAAATGVQIYTCARRSNGLADGEPAPQDSADVSFEWTLKAPEADLFDADGKVIGKHHAGPTWELMDGSEVVGKLKARIDAPEPGAIAWLLLEAKSNAGHGVLTNVKSVQRVDTKGGEAPTGGCDAAHAGAESRVRYGATYYFYD